jgi:hypothetical protein
MLVKRFLVRHLNNALTLRNDKFPAWSHVVLKRLSSEVGSRVFRPF